MGKGKNDPSCTTAVMDISLVGGIAGAEAEADQLSGQLASMSEDWQMMEEAGLEDELEVLAEAKRRSEAQQFKRRQDATRVLEKIDAGAKNPDRIIKNFLSTDNIEPSTDEEQRHLQRQAMLERPSAWSRAMEYRRDRMGKVSNFIARKARGEVAPSSGIERLEFIETFMKSRGFRAHLTNVMAEELYRLENEAPGGKDVENAVRAASIRVIDAEEMTVSTGYWRDQDGREYYVEVMREHSATALFDLVLDVTDLETDERFQSCLQFKSYKQTHYLAEGENPTPGYVKPPPAGKYKIAVSNSTSTKMAGNPEMIAEEVRLRVLATDTYLSVEPTVQMRQGQKVPRMVTNNAVATNPAVHDAITRCSDLKERFKPVRKKGQQKKDGSRLDDYYELQAEVEVEGEGGTMHKVTISHGVKLKANKNGPARNSDGTYKTISGGTGGISVEVPEELVVPFFRESYHTRPVAEAMVKQEYAE